MIDPGPVAAVTIFLPAAGATEAAETPSRVTTTRMKNMAELGKHRHK